MSGRFFSILIFCAVILVARIPKIAWKTMIPAFLAVVLIGVFSPYPPIKSGRGYSNLDIDKNGIDDERGYYYQETGLLAAERNTALPRHKWAKIGFRAGQKGQEVMVYSAVGFFGFFAGPRVHIVDPLALCDPLLARLPAIRDPQWRIGHFERYLPKGYVATLQTGIDSFHDRNLSIYYKKLSLIIRGKLFDWNRIKEIINMNLGKYNDLIRFDYYRHPTRKSIKLSQLKGAFPETSPFRDDNAIEFTESGLRIKLNRAYLADKIEISLENDDDYQLEYYGNFKKISSQKITAMYYQPCGLSIYKLDVPKDAAKKGFDTIMILPLRGDGKYLLGNIRFRSRRAISSF